MARSLLGGGRPSTKGAKGVALEVGTRKLEMPAAFGLVGTKAQE